MLNYIVYQKKLDSDIPNFYLRNKNFNDNIEKKMFKSNDIILEDDKIFSDKFYLKGLEVMKIKSFFSDLRRRRFNQISLNNNFRISPSPFNSDYEVQVNDGVLSIYVYVGRTPSLLFDLETFIKNCENISQILE